MLLNRRDKYFIWGIKNYSQAKFKNMEWLSENTTTSSTLKSVDLINYSFFQYFDMDIINQEFSCQREILVLPKMYGTLDSEYQTRNSRLSSRMSMCKNFSEVQYFHFSGLGKPWTSAEQMSNYLSNFESGAADLIKRWFNYAHTSCPWLVTHSPLWSTWS